MTPAPVQDPRFVVEVYVDADPARADEGEQYVSCDECLRDLANDSMLAATFSPRTFAKQQAAITRTGAIQIRCTRHDANIATFTMRAVKKERQKKGRSDDAKTNK